MLYRKQRASLNIWLTLGLSVLALALGFLAGRVTAPPATLAALVAPDQRHLRQASGALDIVELEYARALQGSAQSAAASLRAAQQAQAEVAQVQVLKPVMPAQIRAVQASLAELEQAIRTQSTKERVAQLIEQVRRRLSPLALPAASGRTPATNSG